MTITTIIPTYNSAETISRAINSVLAQSYQDIEIIVVDDGSTDNTKEVLKKYHGKIKVIIQPKTGGASHARNEGISKASGEYIAFLDADDEWMSNKIELQMERMLHCTSNPGLVTCNSSWIDIDQHTLFVSDYHKTHQPFKGDRVWVHLLQRNFIPTPTVLTKASILNEIGGFNTNLPIAEDLDMWIRIAKKYTVEYRDEILVKFYQRQGSLMKSYGKEALDITMSVITKHVENEKKKLSKKEISQILGRRYHDYGYELFLDQKHGKSLSFLIKSLSYKYRFFKNLVIILRNIIKK